MEATEIEYNPLPYQELFHRSEKPKAFLSAGYGAGKTYSLVMKCFELMHVNHGLAGGLLCPTLKMFKRDVLPTFYEICAENEIQIKHNKTDSYFEFYDTQTILYVFHSEDDGQSIRGPNLGWGAINEVSLCSKAAYDAFIARVRLKDASRRQIAMSGTPEGFGWTYDYFIEHPREDTDLIFGDMRLNTHIADDYAKMLTESYDDKMVQQYVEGKFVNLNANQAAYGFDRKRHLDDKIVDDPDCEKWVSLDFNLNPMAATLWNIPKYPDHRFITAYDEVCLNSSDTYEMAKVLKQRGLDGNTIIFPDPAGKALSTKSRGKSDIDILKEYGFKEIRMKPSIRSVRDCLNAVNNLFAKNKIGIHPKCKNLIADLEQCTIKPGTMDIDKKDPKRTHWLDGLKNMVDYEFPVVKSYSQVRSQKIR